MSEVGSPPQPPKDHPTLRGGSSVAADAIAALPPDAQEFLKKLKAEAPKTRNMAAAATPTLEVHPPPPAAKIEDSQPVVMIDAARRVIQSFLKPNPPQT